MNGLPEPLPPAPCRQDEALVPTELCRSLLRRRSDESDPFRFLGGIVCTCFSQCTSTTSGRVAVFMASWRETGECPSSALPLHSTPLHYVRPRLFPTSQLPLALLSLVLRQRPSDAPPGRASQRSYSTRRGAAAVTAFSNGRALLHAAEEHVPIACSYINTRVGLSQQL